MGNDTKGFVLISFAAVGCVYHEDVANFIGILLNNLLSFLG